MQGHYHWTLPNTEQSHLDLDLDWFAQQPNPNVDWFTDQPPLDLIWTFVGFQIIYNCWFVPENFISDFTSQTLLMVHIIEASSLYAACEPLVYSFKRQTKKITHIPGLRFCHNDSLKNLSFRLSRGALGNKSNTVLWPDLIHNTIFPHSSNQKKPWTTERLVPEFENSKNRLQLSFAIREQTLLTKRKNSPLQGFL